MATRRNDRHLDVANRETWTVIATHRDGRLTVTGPAGERSLPGDYVHTQVELAYASTAHGAQGDTAATAHLALGEHTSAASAYVAMTRGRQRNTAHLIADSIDEAREIWIATFDRDRADHGPDAARHDAARAAANYAQPRPLADLLAELCQQWDIEAQCLSALERDRLRHDDLQEITALHDDHGIAISAAQQRYDQARLVAEDAHARTDHSETVIAAETAQSTDALLAQWSAQRSAARHAANVVLAGPGRLGLRLPAVNRATEHLAHWAVTWQPYVAELPTRSEQIARYAARPYDPLRLAETFTEHARAQAEARHPEHTQNLATAHAAGSAEEHARQQLRDQERQYHQQLGRYGNLGRADDPAGLLHRLEQEIGTTEQRLTVAQDRIGVLQRALAGEPGHADPVPAWRADRAVAQQAEDNALAYRVAREIDSRYQQHRPMPAHPGIDAGRPAPGIGISL